MVWRSSVGVCIARVDWRVCGWRCGGQCVAYLVHIALRAVVVLGNGLKVIVLVRVGMLFVERFSLQVMRIIVRILPVVGISRRLVDVFKFVCLMNDHLNRPLV